MLKTLPTDVMCAKLNLALYEWIKGSSVLEQDTCTWCVFTLSRVDVSLYVSAGFSWSFGVFSVLRAVLSHILAFQRQTFRLNTTRVLNRLLLCTESASFAHIPVELKRIKPLPGPGLGLWGVYDGGSLMSSWGRVNVFSALKVALFSPWQMLRVWA